MKRFNLEVLCFYFKPVEYIIVEAVYFRVEEREDSWSAHEVEEMLEKYGVCVKEVRAVSLRDPVVLRRKMELKESGVGYQSIGSYFEESASNVEGDDVRTSRLDVYGGFLESHLLSP